MQKRTKLMATGVAMLTVIGGGAGVSIAAGGGEDQLSRNDAENVAAAALEHTGQGVVTETETGDSGAAFSAEVRLEDGTQVEVNLDKSFAVIGLEADDDGSGDSENEAEESEAGETEADDEGADADETDIAITGPDLERASQVALDHLGEGRVTDTEVGDEDSYYEIEVTLDDGSQVDVQLDEGFNVVSADPDSVTDD
jgi:hypothetical protein